MKILPIGIAVVESDSHLSKWIEESGTLAVADKFIRQFSQYIPAGGVVADVGACLGDHCATYLDMVGPDGTVHAFEPNPDAYQCLAYNMATKWNCILWPIGLGAKTDQAVAVGDTNLGACQLKTDKLGPIVVERLDDIARGWRRLDWLKIDAEGAEPDIITGGVETIRRLKPAMLVEINRGTLAARGSSAEVLIAQIEALGYSVRPAEAVWSLTQDMVDVLCLPA